MTTFLTTVRMTLAVLSISLGATVALAADKKPSKPAKPNAPAAVQKTNAPAIKSPRDVASGQATGRTQQPLPPKSLEIGGYEIELTSMDLRQSGLPNGRTKLAPKVYSGNILPGGDCLLSGGTRRHIEGAAGPLKNR